MSVTEHPTARVIFEALKESLIFQMSEVCPDCRRNIAKILKRSIPEMLRAADLLAAEYAKEEGRPPAGHCH